MEAKGMFLMPQPQTEQSAGIEIEVMQPTKLVVSAIRLQVPFDDEDDIADDFPGADYHRMLLTWTIDILTGQVAEWPTDPRGKWAAGSKVLIKYRPDEEKESVYVLLDPSGKAIIERYNEVPCCFPSSAADWPAPAGSLSLTIETDAAGGRIKGWKPDPRDIAIDFFGREDD